MLKQVISLQGQQWIRMKTTATRGGRAKQLRISTVLDVWVENESQRPKNEDPPPSKSLINSSKRLSRPEMCKKQQDLQLSMNLSRVFVFYNPPPPPAPTPKVENQDSSQNHLKYFLERKGKR